MLSLELCKALAAKYPHLHRDYPAIDAAKGESGYIVGAEGVYLEPGLSELVKIARLEYPDPWLHYNAVEREWNAGSMLDGDGLLYDGYGGATPEEAFARLLLKDRAWSVPLSR